MRSVRAPWLLAQPYAHRGLWGPPGRPENSMAAFQAAAEAGLGVELDLQLSGDGEAMVFHDAALDRMTPAKGPLSARTGDELAALRLGESDQTIPKFADVLSRFPETPLLVEMKVPFGKEGPLEARTAALLENHRGPVAVMSFNPNAVGLMGELAPSLPRGQLSYSWRHAAGALPWARRKSLRETAEAAATRPDFLAYGLDALSAFGRPAAERLGLPLLAWTVRTERQLAFARRLSNEVIFEHLPPGLVAASAGAIL